MSSADDSAAGRERRGRQEAALVRAMAEGRSEALAELYDRYSGMLGALAQRILKSPSDVEEVLQEVFLQAWNQAGRYNPDRSAVSTWLVLITRSRAIDRLRSRKVVDRTVAAAHKEKDRTHESPRAARDVLSRERRRRLQEEMAALPDEQREVLDLAYYGGMTQSEIAEKTGTPLGTVKTRTLLAMRKLREALQEEIEELL